MVSTKETDATCGRGLLFGTLDPGTQGGECMTSRQGTSPLDENQDMVHVSMVSDLLPIGCARDGTP
jgi:hypothetical protein